MKRSKLKMYKSLELSMFWVHSDSIEPKVLHVLYHCYAAIYIFIEICVLSTFSYTCMSFIQRYLQLHICNYEVAIYLINKIFKCTIK